MNSNYRERAIKRSIAVKQYRFLLKLEKLSREKLLYAAAAEYRSEAANLKEYWNL